MNGFLNGFADELVKLGAAAPLASSPAPAPRKAPSNAMAASAKPLKNLRRLTIDYSGKKPMSTFKSTGKHVPRTLPKAPEVKVKKKLRRKGGRKGGTAGVGGRMLPGESNWAFAARRIKEKGAWDKEQDRQGKYTAHSRDTKGAKAFKKDKRMQGISKGIAGGSYNRAGGSKLRGQEYPILKTKKKYKAYDKQQAYNRKELANRVADKGRVKPTGGMQKIRSMRSNEMIGKHKRTKIQLDPEVHKIPSSPTTGKISPSTVRMKGWRSKEQHRQKKREEDARDYEMRNPLRMGPGKM